MKNRINDFNDWLMLLVTGAVGSPWCVYFFAFLAFLGLSTALKPGNIGFINWFIEQFLQLTLLSAILVGQNLQAKKHDQLHDKVNEIHKELVKKGKL